MLGIGLRAAAPAAVGIVQRRTAQGADLHGRPFKPYSARYGALKRASGRSGNVDLTLTGEMLRRLRVLRADGLRVIVGFEGQHRVVGFAKSRNGGVRVKRSPRTVPMASVVLGNGRTRPFFGLVLRREIDVLVQAAQRAIDAELARLTAQQQQQRK
jgi:hypothetical protein